MLKCHFINFGSKKNEENLQTPTRSTLHKQFTLRKNFCVCVAF